MPVPNHQFLSLWDFFSKVFVPLNRLELPLKALHKHTCDTIEKAILGNLGKSFLIINVPPRVGKTKMVEAATASARPRMRLLPRNGSRYHGALSTTTTRSPPGHGWC